MKKSIIVATITAAVTMSVVGYASDFDLKSLSDDAIIQLLADVNQEIVDRNINKSSEIQPGTYIGGKDIPVGGYDIYSPAGNDDFRFEVNRVENNQLYYVSTDDFDADEDGLSHFYIDKDQKLIIEGRSATITINSGLSFE